MKIEILDEFNDIVDEMLSWAGCGCCGNIDQLWAQKKLLFNRLASLTVDDVCEIGDKE